MKQIIVAIDFSRCSIHALEYAINFANTFKASILLVWVDNVSSDETAMPIELPDSRKVIANNLEALVEKYKDQLKHGEITFKIRRGKVHQEIANQAKYIDFFNNARPLSTRMHQLELLPGLGKKHMWEIIEARRDKLFENFDDVKKRVKLMPDPKKAIIKRVMQELQGIEKHRIFVDV